MTQAKYQIYNKTAQGGPAAVNNIAQWIASLSSSDQWSVIARGDYHYFSDFLTGELSTKLSKFLCEDVNEASNTIEGYPNVSNLRVYCGSLKKGTLKSKL